MKNEQSGARFISIIVFLCLLMPTMLSFAQGPSKAQVLQAQNYFIERNLLHQLVSLSQDDSEQATRFSDVIVVCYQIFRELEKLERPRPTSSPDVSRIQTQMGQLRNQLTDIQKEIPDSDALTEKITSTVLLKIKDIPSGPDDEGIIELKEKYAQLEQDMMKNNTRAAENEKSTRNMKLISIATAVFSGILAVLAAL